jgi:hypothetical protein
MRRNKLPEDAETMVPVKEVAMTPNWVLALIFVAIVAVCLHLQHARGEPQSSDVWVAVTSVRCGKYQGIWWGGVNGAQSFVRFYGKGVERERKNFVVKGDDVFYKGKKCKGRGRALMKALWETLKELWLGLILFGVIGPSFLYCGSLAMEDEAAFWPPNTSGWRR